jgi:hypothetical protein
MLQICFGDVRNKRIITRNHFVSHMVEHIAWRMGLSIDLEWSDENWRKLGEALGAEIRKFPARSTGAAALGMIDDGSASVAVIVGEGPGVEITGAGGVDCRWFLNCRCEQISSGEPLIELAQGLSEGIGCRI